jgi:hypothetical protein
MKTVFKKYLAYVRYLSFHALKYINNYSERFDAHLKILTNEKHLHEVFDLYSIMEFEDS